MKKYLWMIAVAALSLTGCQKTVEDSVTLSSPESIAAGFQEATYNVVFTSNVAWNATIKATSGDVFFSLSKTSGQAGTQNLTLTIQANTVDAPRSGEVVITAGSARATVKINQEAVGETSETKEVEVDFWAQEISVPVTAVPASVTPALDWITVVNANSETEVVLAVSENESTSARTGAVAIVVGKHTIHVNLSQKAQSGELSSVSVKYLGHKADIYDDEAWEYTTFGQYELSFEAAFGSVVLVINENPEEGSIDKTVLPTGEYESDAAGKYAHKTISLPQTSYTINNVVTQAADATASITKDGEKYTIEVNVMDVNEKVRSFKFVGTVPEIINDELGVNVEDAPNYGNYYTYFEGNNLVWTIGLSYSADPAGRKDYLSWITIQVVTANSAAGSAFPTGTFSYAKLEYEEKNGYTATTPGTFSLSGNTIGQVSIVDVANATLTISKEDDGTYSFAITSTVTIQDGEYNDDWEWIPGVPETFEWNPTVSFEMPDVTKGLMATPDAESVTFDANSNAGNYVGYWYGAINGEGHNTFAIGWNSHLNDAYSIFITLDTTQSWEWENNFNNRFCSNPVPAGTYTFANEVGENTLLPTSRCYIQNTYTGTQFRVNGGSITVTDNSVTFNSVTGMQTATGKVCTFSGTFPTQVYYHQNYSTKSLAITPVVGPAE